jgi:hypothetical protein
MDSKDFFNKVINEHGWTEHITPLFWNGLFSAEEKRVHKISIVTTCMDRLDDLSQTLPLNIEKNFDGPPVEFVLIDYNSWIKENMIEYIKDGILNYYRTEEPVGYSMAHSRNIGFRVASGDIVNSVDADNMINSGFTRYVNKLANQQPHKAIFAKGRRMLRGRLGFYKAEFVKLLGGYDEQITGNGSEDHDLMHRAFGLGFTLMHYGGQFCTMLPDHRKHQMENFKEKNWRYTEKRNKVLSFFNLTYGIFKANTGVHWGRAHLVKNFKEIVDI